MKSINEKVEEYVSGFHPSIQRICKESYIDGANYVLETIEDIISNPRRYVSADATVPEWMINDIVECVNQLKSN
jgi:hypothetical protein